MLVCPTKSVYDQAGFHWPVSRVAHVLLHRLPRVSRGGEAILNQEQSKLAYNNLIERKHVHK